MPENQYHIPLRTSNYGCPPGYSSFSCSTTPQQNTTSKQPSQKAKSRKYFQQVQPTFTLDLVTNTPKLEFLDNFDPDKDLVVRRKAREWVNKNKGLQSQTRKAKHQPKETNDEDEKEQSNQLVKKKTKDIGMIHDPLKILGASQKDPFNVLPNIGRKYDHIIDFFMSSCPEEIPCSDDKYVQVADKSVIPFSQDNTIFWNVTKHSLTFTLWLFATVSIRGGMTGNNSSEEIQWFYNKSLNILQETLKKAIETNNYSDHLLAALSCISATANYSGMYGTAVMHRDAMVRMLVLRGGGSVEKGFLSLAPWIAKCIQWCEMMAAAQLAEIPKIPYQTPTPNTPLPPKLAREADRLTALALVSLPPLCEPLRKIIGLMHQLALCYAHQPPGVKIDSYIITPLYNVEYMLLQVLSAQKQQDHGFSNAEVLLAETFQLFFWTGPRQLPSQMRLCDLFVSRMMRALLPLLHEGGIEEDLDAFRARASSVDVQDNLRSGNLETENLEDYYLRFSSISRNTNNAITWSLALGTIVSGTLCRPEHLWFKGRLHSQLQAMGLDKDGEDYLQFLSIFPSTEGFAWIDLKKIPE